MPISTSERSYDVILDYGHNKSNYSEQKGKQSNFKKYLKHLLRSLTKS